MIDYIRQLIWSLFHLVPLHLYGDDKDERRFLCRIGWHSIARGFGWSNNRRMDVCVKCNFSKWYSINKYIAYLRYNVRKVWG